MSLSRSNTPNTTAHTRGDADAIAWQLTTPAADSIDGASGDSGSPRSRSIRAAAAATSATSPAPSTFGTTMPSTPRASTPSRSSRIIPEAGELVLTNTDRAAKAAAPVPPPATASATMRRAAAFSGTGTESSKSKQTMSAASEGAFATNRSLLPGTNARLRSSAGCVAGCGGGGAIKPSATRACGQG